MTLKNLVLVDDQYYNECDVLGITEIVEDHDAYMHLQIINDNTQSKMVHLFCEEKSKKNETTRIEYLRIKKFPDGIIIRELDDHVECYIYELKYNPSNKLEQLKEQLFSGYMHCKSFVNMLGFSDAKVSINYIVGYVKDYNREVEFNKVSVIGRKSRPGKEIVHMSTLDLWKRNKLVFKEQDYELEMPIQKKEFLFSHKESIKFKSQKRKKYLEEILDFHTFEHVLL